MNRIQRPALLIGLSLLSIWSLPASPALSASFDCAKKDLAADEAAICEDRSLNDLDVKMVTTFDLLTGLMPMGNRDAIRDEQVTWLKTRQACGADTMCLKNAYEARMKQLDTAYKSLIRPI